MRESKLETDASDGVVAAVFSHKQDDGEWQPIAYFSKTMAPTELNYEIHDKDMLAIIRGLNHWRAELQGSPHQIAIYTDHKALEYFMSTKNLNARQARWGEILSQFFVQIIYRPGRGNAVADALSRREQGLEPLEEVKKQVRFKPLLKDDQISDEVKRDLNLNLLESIQLLGQIMAHNRSHDTLRDLRAKAVKLEKYLTLKEGLLLYKDRLVIPDADHIRTAIIREVYDHPRQSDLISVLRN